jgi:hypothetical protein
LEFSSDESRIFKNTGAEIKEQRSKIFQVKTSREFLFTIDRLPETNWKRVYSLKKLENSIFFSNLHYYFKHFGVIK